jgi:hypothetical protein
VELIQKPDDRKGALEMFARILTLTTQRRAQKGKNRSKHKKAESGKKKRNEDNVQGQDTALPR